MARRAAVIMPAVSEELDRLAALVARLRLECPWDREQTFDTLKTYLLEETYEVLQALDGGSPEALKDELGDLLFQIFFLSRLAQEKAWFDADAVALAIVEKMTARHPHVFGETKAKDAEEVKTAWERRKRRQRGAGDDPLGSLPAALPALSAAYRQTLRAADLGFDWERDADVVAKIEEEIEEWKSAAATGEPAAETHEIGDLLLSIVNLARRRSIDPETALRAANARFRGRFAGVARRARETGRDVSEVPMEELDAYWEAAKKE